MSDWKPRRFWTCADVVAAPGGWSVHLDGRLVRTPSKTPLILPTPELAERVAAEWQAQEGLVDPRTMPATRTANSAVDKVTPQRAVVADMLAAYGETDLLCYRAERPDDLIARQAAAWDPWLDWAERDLGARLAVGPGIVPVPQDPAATARLAALVHALDPFALAAFHDLVSLSGSLILGLAVIRRDCAADRAWTLSRIDEDWQVEQWGADEEAAEMAAAKRAAFIAAAEFAQLCPQQT